AAFAPLPRMPAMSDHHHRRRGRRSLVLLAVVLILLFLLSWRTALQAQDKPMAGKTLIWGGDANGGIPYVIKDPDPNATKRENEKDGPVTGFEADIRDALEKE